jgi:hypothetical protein
MPLFKSLVPAWQAQQTNQGREDPFHFASVSTVSRGYSYLISLVFTLTASLALVYVLNVTIVHLPPPQDSLSGGLNPWSRVDLR